MTILLTPTDLRTAARRASHLARTDASADTFLTADQLGRDLTQSELDDCPHVAVFRFTYQAIGHDRRQLACRRCEADLGEATFRDEQLAAAFTAADVVRRSSSRYEFNLRNGISSNRRLDEEALVRNTATLIGLDNKIAELVG